MEADTQIIAGILPPSTASNIVGAYLDAPLPGLPSLGEVFPQERYRSKYTLDYVGTPSVGLATSPFGTGLSGAVALYFGDMLGDKVIGGAIQAQGGFKDIGGEVFYLNQEKRWNRMLSASHVPYIVGFQGAYFEEINGTTYEVLERQIQRTFYDQVGATLQYPFSQTRRFEFSVSGTYISYDVEVERYFFLGGQQVAAGTHQRGVSRRASGMRRLSRRSSATTRCSG